MTGAAACPACGASTLEEFHRQEAIPANSCLLLDDRSEAIAFPTGTMRLAFCETCGFIANTGFDPELAEYSGRYEESQAFSGHFVAYAESLAKRWVEDHDLGGRTVLEIGCGKGEFLVMMAANGIGRGIGIDPGVAVDRIGGPGAERCEWIPELFDDEYWMEHRNELVADAVVCRHTLEHIGPVAEFLGSIRRFIGDDRDTVVLFEVPDTVRVLEEVAFWDVYYEHCSYFGAGSLARLFERTGFQVTDIRLVYDDQYLLLEARPASPETPIEPWPADDMATLRSGVAHFRDGYAGIVSRWRRHLSDVTAEGGTAVIWGASSKGVSFLTVAGDHIAAAVDINPHKHGMFMAGTGHRIVAPEELVDLRPDLVVAMNPVYLGEIRSDLDRLGVTADLVAL